VLGFIVALRGQPLAFLAGCAGAAVVNGSRGRVAASMASHCVSAWSGLSHQWQLV
jgi:hypothetical protein